MQWTSPWPLKRNTHTQQAAITGQEGSKIPVTHTEVQKHTVYSMHTQIAVNVLFSSRGCNVWEGLWWHLCSPQQGLSRGRRRVTILALRRLLGHLFINVPGRDPEPQHGGQRRVVQHDPDLMKGEREYIELFIWLFWTSAPLILYSKSLRKMSDSVIFL